MKVSTAHSLHMSFNFRRDRQRGSCSAKKKYIYQVKKAVITIIRFARNQIFLLFFFLPGHFLAAQQTLPPSIYNDVDSFVATVKYENDYIKLARELAAPFPQDLYKTRAIFKWITNNISFDYKAVNAGKEPEVPDCADKYDCAEIIRSRENDYLKKILRTRKATCDGYSKLFQKLCEINHIQSEVIPGYARTKPYQVGNKISVNHSWNAVFIDTGWFFLDLTWAAGHTIENDDGKLVKYIKDYQDYYWLNTFQRLARNHFPKNGYWGDQYNMNVTSFFNTPHYYSTEVLENISAESPAAGVLDCKKDDTLHFCFDYKKDIRFIQINSNNFRNPSLWTTVAISKRKTKLVRDSWAEKKQQYIPFVKEGNTYHFDYVVTDLSLYYIELIFDYKKAMRYKINVGK